MEFLLIKLNYYKNNSITIDAFLEVLMKIKM